MSQTWTVLRHRDVTAWLIPPDPVLREERVAIREAIKSLQEGIPEDAHFIEIDPVSGFEVFRWVEARHWITFMADRDKQWIHVTIVESTTVE